MVDVSYSVGAEVEDGPTILSATVLEEATAYGYIEAEVPKEDGRVVEVHSGDAGDVLLFFMYADHYDGLSYTVDGGGSIDFDGPLMLVGAGCVVLLGATCNELTFTNASVTYDSLVKIFVARVADEEPT